MANGAAGLLPDYLIMAVTLRGQWDLDDDKE
jgi:hypothetical protein